MAARKERVIEFLRRLQNLPPAATGDGAYAQLATTLNAVEDELSGVPYDPARWQSDGRLYPPLPDSARDVPDRPLVTRFRSREHNTFVGTNGSIEVQTMSGDVQFSKAGLDGRGVWDL